MIYLRCSAVVPSIIAWKFGRQAFSEQRWNNRLWGLRGGAGLGALVPTLSLPAGRPPPAGLGRAIPMSRNAVAALHQLCDYFLELSPGLHPKNIWRELSDHRAVGMFGRILL